jgi:hypothetical protein
MAMAAEISREYSGSPCQGKAMASRADGSRSSWAILSLMRLMTA